MRKGADATRHRIFEAAAEEFASRGIAGARIDRIAENASANKALIYTYFGSKQLLFDAVVTDQVSRFFREVHFDARYPAEFAANAHDFYVTHPHLARLRGWHALEEDSPPIDLIATTMRRFTRQLAKAQSEGHVASTIEARQLLQLILAIARTWANPSPEFVTKADQATMASRRRAVTEAVQRLTRPAG
jgi:AcrR family transcriptional regulator